jgi:hypothetical protein
MTPEQTRERGQEMTKLQQLATPTSQLVAKIKVRT